MNCCSLSEPPSFLPRWFVPSPPTENDRKKVTQCLQKIIRLRNRAITRLIEEEKVCTDDFKNTRKPVFIPVSNNSNKGCQHYPAPNPCIPIRDTSCSKRLPKRRLWKFCARRREGVDGGREAASLGHR